MGKEGASDHQTEALSLSLRVAAVGEDRKAFSVTILLPEVRVTVQVVRHTLREAVGTAAIECAEKLVELGYDMTPQGVIAALEEALETGLNTTSMGSKAIN